MNIYQLTPKTLHEDKTIPVAKEQIDAGFVLTSLTWITQNKLYLSILINNCINIFSS